MTTARLLLVASFTALAAAPAVAVNFGSSAGFMGIWSRYVDLDPDDGIRATGTLVDSRIEAKTELFASGGQRVVTAYGSGPATSFLSSQIRPGASATGGLSIIGGGIYPLAEGLAFGGSTSFNAYRATSSYSFAYELAPHTGMLWETSYLIHAWATPNRKAVPSDQASGTVTLLWGANKAVATAYADPARNEGYAMAGGNFSEMLRNDTAAPLVVSGVFGASVFGGLRAGEIAAVPEPSAYALFAAGAGLLGVVVRRRQRAA
jgi:hypothetical protein